MNLIDERRYSELLQKARNLDGEAAMQKFLEQVRETYSLQHAYFAVLAKEPRTFAIAFGTYPDDWRTYYRERNLFKFDPVLTHSLERPTQWASLTNLTENEAAVMRMRESHGIGPHGMTIPVRNTNGDIALMTLTGDDPDAESWFKRVRILMREVREIGMILLAAYMESNGAKPAGVDLSQRHIDCIRLLGHGMSVDDIAHFHGRPKGTTAKIIEEAKTRLRARTHAQLIYNAVQLGFLEV